jgi:nucleoside-diphosphate-sugar epimerase
MGPPLTPFSDSESIKFMKTILSGAYSAGAPDLTFGFVDVRDVARAHIAALTSNQAEGRFILSNTSLSFLDFTALIKKHYGNTYKLPGRKFPKALMYAIGWMFGLSLSFIKNNVGFPVTFNNTRSKQVLNIQYTPIDSTIRAMIDALENQQNGKL